jgi:hypothetical protein
MVFDKSCQPGGPACSANRNYHWHAIVLDLRNKDEDQHNQALIYPMPHQSQMNSSLLPCSAFEGSLEVCMRLQAVLFLVLAYPTCKTSCVAAFTLLQCIYSCVYLVVSTLKCHSVLAGYSINKKSHSGSKSGLQSTSSPGLVATASHFGLLSTCIAKTGHSSILSYTSRAFGFWYTYLVFQVGSKLRPLGSQCCKPVLERLSHQKRFHTGFQHQAWAVEQR